MLTTLSEMNIRDKSTVWAIQDINEYYPNRNRHQYESYVANLTGVIVVAPDTLTAEMIFKYVVVGLVEKQLGGLLDYEIIVINAVISAKQIVALNGPAMLLTRDTTNSVSEDDQEVKKVVHRQGISKREQAFNFIEINKLLDKPTILELLAVELSISKQNALVYYYKWIKSQSSGAAS